MEERCSDNESVMRCFLSGGEVMCLNSEIIGDCMPHVLTDPRMIGRFCFGKHVKKMVDTLPSVVSDGGSNG